jgi:hypothetical protein
MRILYALWRDQHREILRDEAARGAISRTECERAPYFGVTFTRNAAASLIEDLLGLGIEGCERIRAGTLHSFCLPY